MDPVENNDLDALLEQLEAEESGISSRRRLLHERLAIFPSAHGQAEEAELSRRRRELHARIDDLREHRRDATRPGR